jgi:hypothetical protein
MEVAIPRRRTWSVRGGMRGEGSSGRIPFISTSALWDLRWTLLLLPVWWVLGMEQFVPPVLLTWSAVKLVWRRRAVRLNPVYLVYALFLVSVLLSAQSIESAFRLISFMRSFGVHLCGFLAVFIVVNEVDEQRQIDRLLGAVFFTVVISAVIAVVAFLGIRPVFTSLAGAVLPESLTSTGYGGLIAHRNLGRQAWLGLGFDLHYYRVSSLFLYPNMLAVAIAASFPVGIYLMRKLHGLAKCWYWLALAIMLAAMALTTSRMTVIAFLVAMAIVVVAGRRPMRLALLTILLGLAVVALNVTTFGPVNTVEQLSALRGSGSTESRLLVYRNTLEAIPERWLTGWGTERDLVVGGKVYSIPLGSHSHYLGVLFKHGSLGFILLLALLRSIWIESSPRRANASSRGLRSIGRASLVVMLVVGLTTSWELDMILYLILFCIVGCLVTNPGRSRRSSLVPDSKA